MFELEIATDNDAFADGDEADEIARILSTAAQQIRLGRMAEGVTRRQLFDSNGNAVGWWALTSAER